MSKLVASLQSRRGILPCSSKEVSWITLRRSRINQCEALECTREAAGYSYYSACIVLDSMVPSYSCVFFVRLLDIWQTKRCRATHLRDSFAYPLVYPNVFKCTLTAMGIRLNATVSEELLVIGQQFKAQIVPGRLQAIDFVRRDTYLTRHKKSSIWKCSMNNYQKRLIKTRKNVSPTVSHCIIWGHQMQPNEIVMHVVLTSLSRRLPSYPGE
jgi:hypothetical protein